jgi:U3 small nucleolar RNA-associated protein 10
VGQLKHAQSLSLEVDLIPCVTSFATAAESPDHLKAINTKLLGHMRSDHAAVRRAAVCCEISLTEGLGEEWLNLLPEMLPAISEAMEDDDESVEDEVRKWAKQIEEILGESLDSMLQ